MPTKKKLGFVEISVGNKHEGWDSPCINPIRIECLGHGKRFWILYRIGFED